MQLEIQTHKKIKNNKHGDSGALVFGNPVKSLFVLAFDVIELVSSFAYLLNFQSSSKSDFFHICKMQNNTNT